MPSVQHIVDRLVRFGEGGRASRAQTPQRLADGPPRLGQSKLDAALGERGLAGRVAAGHLSKRRTDRAVKIAEVMVTVVCRELQNSQNTSPPNRHA